MSLKMRAIISLGLLTVTILCFFMEYFYIEQRCSGFYGFQKQYESCLFFARESTFGDFLTLLMGVTIISMVLTVGNALGTLILKTKNKIKK